MLVIYYERWSSNQARYQARSFLGFNQMSKQYWAMGADGGNKGRAMEMMAYCMWDAVTCKPVVKPLAASDLHTNQTAANGTAPHLRAVKHLGLRPECCTAFSTDGTTHARCRMQRTPSPLCLSRQ